MFGGKILAPTEEFVARRQGLFRIKPPSKFLRHASLMMSRSDPSIFLTPARALVSWATYSAMVPSEISFLRWRGSGGTRMGNKYEIRINCEKIPGPPN